MKIFDDNLSKKYDNVAKVINNFSMDRIPTLIHKIVQI